MTPPSNHTPPPSAHEARELLHQLQREGFSAEEADLALREAGIVPPGPAGYGALEAGRTPYLLGLLAWLPIPFVSVLIAGVAMAAAYPSQRKRSALAAENARRAANWGLTYVLGVVLSIAATILMVLVAQGADTAGPDASPWPLVFLLPIFGLGIAHLVITIMGIRRTSSLQAFNPPGVPFFRAATPEVARAV
ncbi:DUF4870 domain-containing protein [Cellulomonas chengniuliangii]|uniref:DUF4870 domain-containing protein n=1 Tax=Cellulomonas chengniuliangii TaxID=2968084 RepID=A0ABY5KYC5_9CELL|nr:DUF4870 domain-containing protein [Cellulomonas chengniuliangii]MCC2309267.1 DUF4870 domain-containing protein [Cellulomonas chengniuliangii]MCC2318611.1 DUF4870 domain-containing protein [Cellulomonas chengniuliangii]UUI75164.1 DUF4870 domain-containing protein [Cellulomonas chengniuliangii]